MTTKLKPCPFCGGEAMIVNPRPFDSFSIIRNARMQILCWGCHNAVDYGHYHKAWDELTDEDVDVIRTICASQWNKRVTPPEDNN